MYRDDVSFTESKPQKKYIRQPPVNHNGCKVSHYLGMAKIPGTIVDKLFIGEWMAALNVRPTDLAKRVGVSKAYISQLAHNPRKAEGLTRKREYAIAAALGITVQLLLHPPPSTVELEHLNRFDQSTLERIRRALKARDSAISSDPE